MATTPSTNFDFDSIKQDLINAIKSDPTFTDYNFEGSALNALVDILANNTFNNAFLASASHAENFIDSAQRRSSVVSRGTEMGYTPTSARCSTAYVDLFVLNTTGNVSLQRGFEFTSSNDNGSYTFSVANDTSTVQEGSDRVARGLKLVEGVRVKNQYFKVDTTTNIRSIFTIPNKNIDTTTLKVFVRSSLYSNDNVEYTLAENEYGLTSDSTVFFLQESYNGYYQIYFGNDVIGKQPVTNNIISLDYFVSDNLDAANGCKIFTLEDVVFGGSSGHTNTTVQDSFGGTDKEDIDSIRVNAKKSNSAKFRAVKDSDYQLLIKQQFPYIKSVSVWGGEKNVPPVYGKVFFALQPTSGYIITDATKRDVIIPAIKKMGVMTIIPEIVDPEYLILEFDTKLKFNISKTTTSIESISSIIKNSIKTQIDTINTFNSDLIQSKMTTKLDQIDPGIVGVSVSKRIGFRISPLIDSYTSYTRSINNQIERDSIASTKYRIIYNGLSTLVSIKEVPDKDYTEIVNGITNTFRSLGVYTDSGNLVEVIGNVNLYSGKFTFFLKLSAYATFNRFVQITMRTVSDDILSFRNQILQLVESNAPDVVIGLIDNNQVTVENYTK